MSDSTKQSVEIISHDEFLQKSMQLTAENKYAEAAEFAFSLYNAVIDDFRANKDTDKPSIKKASELFEASEEVEQVAKEVLGVVRELVHARITENPELSVLLYEQLKDYAQDHVKVFRDAVLRGYMNEVEDDENESDYELPMTKEELKQVRASVDAFVMFAEMNKDRAPKIPVKKSGSFAFNNPRGYGESGNAVRDTKDEVKFTYLLDGEEVPARTTADVALWHVSTADNVVTASDIYKIVRKQHGNTSLSDGWTIEVNGHTLTAVPVTN